MIDAAHVVRPASRGKYYRGGLATLSLTPPRTNTVQQYRCSPRTGAQIYLDTLLSGATAAVVSRAAGPHGVRRE